MVNRKHLNAIFTYLIIASMVIGGSGQAYAKGTPPTQPTNTPASGAASTSLPYLKKGPITAADRAAAAATRLSLMNGKLKGLNTTTPLFGNSVLGAPTPVYPTAMDPSGVPDYFGATPNYALSPLPPVVTIGVPECATGATPAPLVPGSACAQATAIPVVQGGQIISIFVSDPGAGYIATPAVDFTSALAGAVLDGSGATATASLTGGSVSGIAVNSSGAGYTGIRKFVDTLPGLGTAGVNDLGNYIPVASADDWPADPANPKSLDSDYYEIGLVQYCQQFSKDLPPTLLRGYVQVETATLKAAGKSLSVPLTNADKSCDPTKATPVMMNGVQVLGIDTPHYLGPIILAGMNKPSRITFRNFLPTGTGGDLFIPTDPTVMGAGVGPDETNSYAQNRATLHLHGGATPWISDGTPHQWTAPANEGTPWPKGVSVSYVPDMWFDPITHVNVPAGTAGAVNNPGDGSLTFYYTNQQSARLMFYHDHALGTTRLNVYAGEAAGYVVTDSVDTNLYNAGLIPGPVTSNIPLVLQDRTFVPGANQLLAQDPTWDSARWNGYGNLWYPHVYMTNQNPWDPSGANANGRWDWGPWFWPPWTVTNNMIPNPHYDPTNAPWEPPFIPPFINPSLTPEAFVDTPVVNGQAYPTVTLDPKPYRFRILNAANDRTWDLSLYRAASNSPMWSPDGTLLIDPNAGEVPMVPANLNPAIPFPHDWTVASGGNGIRPDILDGRPMGVPDPRYLGPNWIQIGTEGGVLPNPVVIPPSPTGYEYNLRNIVVTNITKHSLLVGPAERADVIVDFTDFAGQTLILYNDAPAPVPAGDPRLDYYTGSADNTYQGGAPTTLAGYGPNIRTIMQIKITGTAAATPFQAPSTTLYQSPYEINTLPALTTALPAQYATVQPEPIVPEPDYNAAFGKNYPQTIVRIQDTSVPFFNGPLTGFNVVNPGAGYTSAPSVTITGGGATTNATASAVLSAKVASVALNTTPSGTGYTSAPVVAISGGGGTGATATAKLTPTSIASVTVTAGGTGYVAAPLVYLVGGGGKYTSATAMISGGSVTAITVVGSSGYTSAPTITFSGGKGLGVTARANLTPTSVASITLTASGTGYSTAPSVSFIGGGGASAAATATLGAGVISKIKLANPGAGYTSAPTVALSASGATTAAVVQAVGFVMPLGPKAIQELFDNEWGRMNALLGVEIPNTNGVNQTTIPYGYIDPATELFKGISDPATPLGALADGTQLWKITHNGVDTHAVHFHMFNVQVINRVGWDGAVRLPYPNELGWKDTVMMSPLEDVIVAMRPILPQVPWDLPNSVRPIAPAAPLGSTMGFFGQDPSGNPVTVVNQVINYGWEYVWHCHLLGHEENDMMRPMSVAVTPVTPSNMVATVVPANRSVHVTWTDNSQTETGFTLQRSTSLNGPWTTVTDLISGAAGTGSTLSADDFGPFTARKVKYFYRIVANNVIGYTDPAPAPATGYDHMGVDSLPAVSLGVIP